MQWFCAAGRLERLAAAALAAQDELGIKLIRCLVLNASSSDADAAGRVLRTVAPNMLALLKVRMLQAAYMYCEEAQGAHTYAHAHAYARMHTHTQMHMKTATHAHTHNTQPQAVVNCPPELLLELLSLLVAAVDALQVAATTSHTDTTTTSGSSKDQHNTTQEGHDKDGRCQEYNTGTDRTPIKEHHHGAECSGSAAAAAVLAALLPVQQTLALLRDFLASSGETEEWHSQSKMI